MSRATLAVIALAALMCAPERAYAADAPELDPYAAYARSGAARALLGVAREGLCAGLGACDSVVAAAPDWPAAPRPVFVTLARGRVTRACLGSDAPLGTLAQTVRELASRAVTDDRRHPPLGAEELVELRLIVAFAGDGASVADPYVVDPLREGLRIETDAGSLVFLPGEARTIDWALSEARRAGVLHGPLADARFIRFHAVVIQGPAAGAAPPSRETAP